MLEPTKHSLYLSDGGEFSGASDQTIISPRSRGVSSQTIEGTSEAAQAVFAHENTLTKERSALQQNSDLPANIRTTLTAGTKVEQAMQNLAIYALAIEKGREAAAQSNQDPAEAENAINQLVLQAMKADTQGKECWKQIGTALIGVKWENRQMQALQSGDYLAEGTYGCVYKIVDIASGKLEKVLKIPKTDEDVVVKALKGITNESTILADIHKAGHVTGIQKAPDEVITLNLLDRSADCYVTVPYDYDLNSPEFKELQSYERRLAGAKNLLSGLKSAHAAGYVHRDIKPANCCSHDGEHQIADWGDAKHIDAVNLKKPLGVSSPFYTSDEDATENRNISGYYGLHLAATGRNQDPIFIAKSLNYLLLNYFCDETGTTNMEGFDDQLIEDAKLYIASVIKDMDADTLEGKYMLYKDCYKAEIEQIQNADIPLPDLSRFAMNAEKLHQLKEQAQNLCKRHDVFSMAVTILQNLTTLNVADEKFEELDTDELYKLMLNDLDKVNSELATVISDVINALSLQRPTAEEFLTSFLGCI